MLARLSKLLPEVFLVSGAVAVSYGAWLAYKPAGFVVAGVLAIYAGIRLA